MNASIRTAVLAALLGATLGGCSRPDASPKELAAAISETTGGAVPSVAAVSDDPCKLLTRSEVRDAFAGVHLPALRGCGDQKRARRRACLS